jgi:hypothetical protein
LRPGRGPLGLAPPPKDKNELNAGRVPGVARRFLPGNLSRCRGVVAVGSKNEGVMPMPVSKDWLFVGGLAVVVVAFCAVACDLV